MWLLVNFKRALLVLLDLSILYANFMSENETSLPLNLKLYFKKLFRKFLKMCGTSKIENIFCPLISMTGWSLVNSNYFKTE
jgi:hypothetical protein